MGEPDNYNLCPRLCILSKRNDFNGFGFNLHAEKTRSGQFIGKIDPESPAERGNLKQGDRLVEVDGVQITNENHQQVVARIRASGDVTRLLVVDTETDKHFKENNELISSSHPKVKKCYSDEQDNTEEVIGDNTEKVGENGNIHQVEINGTVVTTDEATAELNGQTVAYYENNSSTNINGHDVEKVIDDDIEDRSRTESIEVQYQPDAIGEHEPSEPDIQRYDREPSESDSLNYDHQGLISEEHEQFVHTSSPQYLPPDLDDTDNRIPPPCSDYQQADLSEPEDQQDFRADNEIQEHPDVEEPSLSVVEVREPEVEQNHVDDQPQQPEEPEPEPVSGHSEPEKKEDDPFAGLTAKEMRKRLNEKKREDIRSQKIDFKDKLSQFEKLK